MTDETMPDVIYVRDCNWVNGCLPVGLEPSAVFKEARYIRADRTDPAILAAMDETIKYFDDEYPCRDDVDARFVCQEGGGLTVGMLRALRGMFA